MPKKKTNQKRDQQTKETKEPNHVNTGLALAFVGAVVLAYLKGREDEAKTKKMPGYSKARKQ